MPHEHESVALYCHAPHPDPRRLGETCGSELGRFPYMEHHAYVFDAIRPHGPEEPDNYLWVQCPRKTCSWWNRFRFEPRP